MKQIRVVFETGDKKIGYILDSETKKCISGKFDPACEKIVEVVQDEIIDNPEELCRQIYFVLLAGLKNG